MSRHTKNAILDTKKQKVVIVISSLPSIPHYPHVLLPDRPRSNKWWLVTNLCSGRSDACWWLTNLSIFLGANTNDALVHCCLNAIILLDIKLWHVVVIVCGCITDISKGGSINNVTDRETLDCLVLWDCLRGRRATNAVGVTPSVLVAAVVSVTIIMIG